MNNDVQLHEHEPQLPTFAEPQQEAFASTTSLVLDQENLKQVMAFAEFMAAGKSTIPVHFRGNSADCAAVIIQSMQWRMSPFAVAQKTHLVNGILGYEAQLINAVITALAPTKDRLHYEWFGDWSKVIGKFRIEPAKGDKKEYRVPGWMLADEDGLGVRVWATMKGEDEPRVLELLLSQASVRNSPLWATDPKQQLAYLGVKRWSRLYCPDVIMGVYTPDEIDPNGGMRDVNQAPARSPRPVRESAAQVAQRNQAPVESQADIDAREKLQADMSAVADEGLVALEAAWKRLTKEQRQLHGPLSEAMKNRAADIDNARGSNYVPE